jgi:hypothetical protein
MVNADLFLDIIVCITFLVANIIFLAKKKKNLLYSIISLVFSIVIFYTSASNFILCLFNNRTSLIGNYIPFLFLSLINFTLNCFIVSNKTDTRNKEKQEEQVEMKNLQCSECNCEAEAISKTFANTTEKGKMKVGNRQWFDIYSTFNITYKCPQCGKTWTENKKEKTGKKLKKYDKLTRTWVEYDDAIF